MTQHLADMIKELNELNGFAFDKALENLLILDIITTMAIIEARL